MDVIIKPLTPDLIDDFLYFFDEIGFVDNPDWAGCYCNFFHFPGSRKKWSKRTGEQNRESSKALIESGKMKGFLAYSNGKPVGWCNANIKENYSYFPFEKQLDNQDNQGKIAAVVCFLIAPSFRRQGLSRQLLKTVCEYYKDRNCDFIEGYPIKEYKLDAHNYHGPYNLYLSEGFSIYKELKTVYILRKKL